MKIFMLGWEFPPFISGGLGTACYGLTRGLNDLGHHVIFVLPHPVASKFTTHVQLKSPKVGEGVRSFGMGEFPNVEFHAVPSTLQAYANPRDEVTDEAIRASQSLFTKAFQSADIQGFPRGGQSFGGHYGGDMFLETRRYANIALELSKGEDFDVVHAHDWMTFPAGVAVAQASGRPLVVHVHSTEFDRSGENIDRRIYDVERDGVHRSDRVIAVSHLTRNILLARFAAPADKVSVVYNAIENNGGNGGGSSAISREEKIVLFLGRITMQKGPEYFLAAARKVLEFENNVRFVMAGSGDMTRRAVELASELGLGDRVIFTGFLRGDDVARIFKLADLYVMPSVSEPFGIAPLEALSHDVPVLISKQSGVSEVLNHVLKVDFWDVNEMANKIVAVLRHPPLHAALREHGNFEIQKLTWRDSAQNCVNVYQSALSARNGRA